MSLRAKIAQFYLLRKKVRMVNRQKNKPFDPLLLRKWMDRLTSDFKPPAKVKFEPITINDCYAEWVIPTSIKTNQVLLYLHGGAYVGGSSKKYRGLTGKLAQVCNIKTLAFDYSLAPENPFPKGLNDVVAAYKWLLKIGYQSSEIIVAGDSAGGGLALSTVLNLRDKLKMQPGGLILLSPWTDVTATNPSITKNERIDPILSGDPMVTIGQLYAGDYALDDPGVSPMYADHKGLCPVLVHVGSEEILLDDSVLLVERLKKVGVEVKLKVWQGCMHVFHLSWKYVPEGRKAIKEIDQFIKGLQQR